MKPPFVYFMQPDHAGAPIKIGHSVNTVGRLRSLNVWSPYPLTLLATAPGDVSRENWVHKRFRHLRLHGEWFESAAELVEYAEAVSQTGDLPGAPPFVPFRPFQDQAAKPVGALLKAHGLHPRDLAAHLGLKTIVLTDWNIRVPVKHTHGVAAFFAEHGIEIPVTAFLETTPRRPTATVSTSPAQSPTS